MTTIGPKSTTKLNVLAWHRSDVEQKLGFRGGRFTRANSLLSFLIALLATAIFYSLMEFVFKESAIGQIFTERGYTPYLMSVLFMWSLAMIFFKWRKLCFQRRSLKIEIVPAQNDFVLSASTVDQVMSRLIGAVDDPKKFLLLNRIQTALSNFRNLGRVTDVDEMLRSQADLDESSMQTSYSLLRGFIWAVPVLGFIGTVVGLSKAIGKFGDAVGNSSDAEALKEQLPQVTNGLHMAFDTTLIALLFALLLQLLVTFLHKNEEEFLDDCSEYCQKNVVSKLRIMPFDAEAET